jgi:cell division protein FtsN
VTDRPKPTTITKSPAETKTERKSDPPGTYSVQVAAYNHRADAEKLVSSLNGRGYDARVDGDVAPFRVRIGRYSTAAQAEEALKRIKAKHMEGFVLRVPQR